MPTNVNDLSGYLFDVMIVRLGYKNDAELARQLICPAPQISKIRNGKLPIGPSMILKSHELTGWPIKEIKRLIAGRSE